VSRHVRQRRAREKRHRSVNVTVPARQRQPDTVVAHLGPTNSGKTHDALQFLLERGQGTFAAPLRMLAHEAYERLRAQAGPERVGLLTGEERVNERAPIICATAEMAPRYGDVLVLDEVHWAADDDRGQAWTRLLLAGDYRHIRLVGAADALPLLRCAFGDQLEVRLHDRLAPLHFAGAVDFADVQPDTIVVAFSRRVVLWLAGRFAERYGPEKVCALYGAMPPEARRRQMQRFMDADAGADFCVATDVLGHGVNLPCATVLFAETDKFDGERRRPLERWEAAQIAGRAGRFGHHDQGHVGVLVGLNGPLAADPALVERSLTAPVEVENGVYGYREVERGRLRASLDDLGGCNAAELSGALTAWERRARRELRAHDWVSVEPTVPLRGRMDVVRMALGGRRLRQLDTETAWRLATCPLDSDNDDDRPVLAAFAQTLAGQPVSLRALVPKAIDRLSLADAEHAARRAAALRWFCGMWPDAADVTAEQAARLEGQAARQVSRQLRGEISRRTVGQCERCRQEIAPWFTLCMSCR
jgi:ATP-dependent RNA helicase SUPV3L1/SUV3